MQIDKVYEPQRFEPHWAQWWIDSGLFRANSKAPGKVFSLRQIIDLLDQHPEIAALNSRCKDIYEKNLQRIRKPTVLRARS